MYKKLILILMSLLVIGMASAIEQPVDNVLLTTIDQPIPPSGSDTTGDCVPWEVKDKTCIEDVYHYTQCQENPAGGGRWIPRSIDCKSYGESVSCVSGDGCKRLGIGLPIEQQYQTWIIVGLIIFIVVMMRRK